MSTTLLEEIKSRCPAEVLATKNPEAIAAAVSVGRVRANTREIGNGMILETLGLAGGNALLDVINGFADFRHVKPLIEQGRLSIGSPLVQSTIQSMVPAVLTKVQADALCALGLEPDPVSEYQVRCALWNEVGNWIGG